MTEQVNHPSHYTMYEHEVIELTRLLSFDVGNCCKYLLRAPFKKDAIEDIQKALWYAKDYRNNAGMHGHAYLDSQAIKNAHALSSYFATQIRARGERFTNLAKLFVVIVNLELKTGAWTPDDIALLDTIISICEKVE